MKLQPWFEGFTIFMQSIPESSELFNMINNNKLNSYSNAKAIDLRNTNQNETLNRNIRRIFSRFWKCFFLRKGYKEKEMALRCT